MFIFINYKCKQQQHHLSWVFGFGGWLADSVKQGTINASSFCSPAKIYPPTTRLRPSGTHEWGRRSSQPTAHSLFSRFYIKFLLNGPRTDHHGISAHSYCTMILGLVILIFFFLFCILFWVTICCWFISTVLSLGSVRRCD